MANFLVFPSRPKLFITTAAVINLAVYHLHWVHRIRRYPMTTSLDIISHVGRKRVVSDMNEKRDIMAVKTMRNLAMAAGFLASTTVLVNLGLLGTAFRPGVHSEISHTLNLSGEPIDTDPHYSAGNVEKDDIKYVYFQTLYWLGVRK